MLVIGAGNSMLLAVAPPLRARTRSGQLQRRLDILALGAAVGFSEPVLGTAVRSASAASRSIAFGLFAYAVSMAAVRHGSDARAIGRAAQGSRSLSQLMLARAIFGAFGSASSPSAQAYIADRTTAFERTDAIGGPEFGVRGWPSLRARRYARALAARLGLVFPIWMVGAVGAGRARSRS